MSDDDSDNNKSDNAARRTILARRAKFVAVALAGIACGKTSGEPTGDPRPCLNIAVSNEDAGPPPQPCLSQPMPTTTTPQDAGKPHPCLKAPLRGNQ